VPKDIKKLMDELAKDSDRIIVNPNDLKNLLAQGLPIKVIPAQTIDKLFEERKENAF
jgi:hypothetical protein